MVQISNFFVEKKRKGELYQVLPSNAKESRTMDMNKLRMTGFECFAVFVIR
jgi:hypothetical protein